MNTRKIGSRYEDLACSFLKNNHYKLIARNYLQKIGEIDIICLDKDTVVFVEVKYRHRTDYGGAEYSINKEKQRKIRRTAELFLKEKGLPQETYCRFDAILIDGSTINHIINAF